MKRKKIKPKVGDVFAVPMHDGTFGLGLIVHYYYAPSCALFAARAAAPEVLLTVLDEALKQPLTIMVLTDEELRTGEWPIIAHRSFSYPGIEVPVFADERYWSHTATAAPAFLLTYHGVAPWDSMADPKYWEKMLLPGVPVPPTVRYKRDFSPAELRAFTGEPEPSPPVKEGPAEVTIQIVYPGKGLPPIDLLRTRHELERRLEASGAGKITGAESGAGVMEVFLETDDVQRTLPLIEKHAAELGLQDDLVVETAPLNTDDDEDEEDEENDDDEEDGKE